jgi:hypothetical protein
MQDKKGRTPLDVASGEQREDIIKLLYKSTVPSESAFHLPYICRVRVRSVKYNTILRVRVSGGVLLSDLAEVLRLLIDWPLSSQVDVSPFTLYFEQFSLITSICCWMGSTVKHGSNSIRIGIILHDTTREEVTVTRLKNSFTEKCVKLHDFFHPSSLESRVFFPVFP